MGRAALLGALFGCALALPSGCGKLGRRAPDEGVSPPPPVPVTSATAPPVWVPPENASPPSSTPAPASAANPDLVRARALAQAGDHKRVRALLERKVRAGKATREEAAVLLEACVALRDKACFDAVKAKHPDVDTP